MGELCFESIHEGSGRNVARQERPHAHCVRVAPDNRFVVVADLGIDSLIVYRFDAASGVVERRGAFALAASLGPRHFAFHPRRPFAYSVNELDSTLASLSYDLVDGRFALLTTTSILPTETLANNFAFEVAITSNSQHIFVPTVGMTASPASPSTRRAGLRRSSTWSLAAARFRDT